MPRRGSDSGGSAREPVGLRVLPWLALAIASAPLVTQGFPAGHDWSFELVRVAEYQRALEAGQLPPYWAENLYGGYGSPAFLFYAPLFALGASGLGWVTGSVASGATLWLVGLTALGVLSLLRMLEAATGSGAGTDRGAARAGTYLFVLHPYLLGDKFVRNANAEYAALCLAPLAFAGLLVASSHGRRGFVLISLGLAATILAHNLTALISMALLLLGALVLYGPEPSKRGWITLGAGLGFGLALSAFFWLPAVWLTPLVRPEELLAGKLDFHQSFQSPITVLGYQEYFSTGLLTPAAWFLAIAALAVRRPRDARTRRLLVAVVVAGASFLFLVTPGSLWIWETLPLLPLFQFPWRMLGPLALVAALAATLGFSTFLAGHTPGRRIAAELAVFALCTLNALPALSRAEGLPPAVRSMLPTLLDPATIRTGTPTVTVTHEYLPRRASDELWRRERPSVGPVVSVEPPCEITVERNLGSRIALVTSCAAPARLRVARFAFPGWKLHVDGEESEPTVNPEGSLDLEVPAGRARLRLHLEPPRLRRIALGASGVALLAWIAVLWRWPGARGS